MSDPSRCDRDPDAVALTGTKIADLEARWLDPAYRTAVRETARVRQETLAKAVRVPLRVLRSWEAGDVAPAGPGGEAYYRILGEFAEQQAVGRV